MPSSEYKRIDFRFRHSTILALGLLMGFSFFACSRSAWIKPDGHEVSPTEQLDCAQHVQENSRGEVLEQQARGRQIEQCMLNKGYQHRPWWHLTDLHWHLNPPPY